MKKTLFLGCFALIFSLATSVSAENSAPSFSVRNFSTCQEVKDTLSSIMQTYSTRYWTPYPIMYDRAVSFGSVGPMAVGNVSTNAEAKSVSTPVSTTNTQVAGVDEADIVKTDGNTIYTYRSSNNTIEIVSTKDLAHLSTISVGQNISNVNLYVSGNRLVVVGSKYQSASSYWSYRWYAPDNKTLVAVYSINDKANPVLTHKHEVDGNINDSRLIGNTLYFITQTDFRIAPYYTNLYAKSTNQTKDTLTAFGKDFSLKNIVPEIRDIVPNPKRTGTYLTSVRAGVANRSDLSLILPDRSTMKNTDISPVFTTIASLDISDTKAKIKNSLVFGAVNQIHMSQTSLYLVSNITKTSTSKCPANAKCLVLDAISTSSTLIHRFALNGGKAIYKNSTEVTGNPMNQYSMEEDAVGNFRIVTQSYSWSSGTNQNATNLFIINSSGKVIGSLTGIAKGENFQSARFMGDRLYLVTFQQIDPLFVISLKDPTNPMILGELKMPGYSTYLHPYDADRIIGIGYDTITNQWGGTQNAGLKIDLYNVANVTKPVKEGSLILGDAGSSSEVLTNPRAFVYYKEKNLLLLPATLMTSANDPDNSYRSKKVFQGLVGVEILPNTVTEKWRVSHLPQSSILSAEWKKDCAQYTASTKPTCVKLLDGSSYCPGSTQYVPTYCYAGATVDEYFTNQIWNYSQSFVTRSIYVGDSVYSLSENGIKSWTLPTPIIPKATIDFKTPDNQYKYPIRID